MNPKDRNITILGGGPAGMAVAYYANAKGYPFTVFEASGRIGGNCTTLQHGDFRYDSGAHRFHDIDPEVTEIIKMLVGDQLKEIQVPSQIFRDGKFTVFPLSPIGLLRFLGPFRFVKATFQVIGRIGRNKNASQFEELVLSRYGRIIADLFLLHYSKKLWGLPAAQLSPEVAGERLKGLNLKTFLWDVFRSKKARTAHLDGNFLYPEFGIGEIFESLYAHCGKEHFSLHSRITRILHTAGRITAVEVDGRKEIAVDEVVSTLPLGLVFDLLDPAPPEHLRELAKSIRFRNLILIGYFLDKTSVNLNGSMYFPSKDYPFTRVFEPRNRSKSMAPPGKTSLIVEIPCQADDPLWNQDQERLTAEIRRHLLNIGFFEPQDLQSTCFHRIENAYPILEMGFTEKIEPLMSYLEGFSNLKLSGRNGLFSYSHIHDHFRNAKKVIIDLD